MDTKFQDCSGRDELGLTSEERNDLVDSISGIDVPISFRNQDFDVRGLVQRLDEDDILVPRIGRSSSGLELNAFQRGFVWNNKQMDAFVESLLLEYPTPSIFLVKQHDRRLIVLDGQQRLETLRRFYSGFREGKEYRLKLDGRSRFNGLSYSMLKERDRRVLDDTYITATVISAGTTNESRAFEAIYDVFARLNSGGTQLTAHEIRMALYNGELMELIDQENRNPSWRKVYGSDQPNKRFRDHELVLRIIALYLEEDVYAKPLAKFLNRFSEGHRVAPGEGLHAALSAFGNACRLLSDCLDQIDLTIGDSHQKNTALIDSVVVGLMRAAEGHQLSAPCVIKGISRLKQNEDYLFAISRSTSDETQVHTRISLATKAFIDE